MKRLLPILVLAVLAAMPAGAALAQETTTTTTTMAPSTTVPEPAVPVVPETPAVTEKPWTYRFIIPTLMVVTVAFAAGLAGFYYFRIKTRYRVVR
jgi:hypothetical protein